ncbi:MAG: cytochrome c-type biogenesis protein CcmH [Candidatus Poribacteria bacterium]|nr:cytochrome c-type biogenesis protein CcmH [Candidatus Poribacteria bacterium]
MKTLQNLFAALLILSILSLSLTATYAQELSGVGELSLESKFDVLASSVYCFCGCNRETIQQCICGNSQQVENDFRNRLAVGATIEQIRNDYIAKHGTQYSALMPAEGFNIVAYVMPAIIILVLGGVVFFVLKLKIRSPLAPQPVSTKQQPSTSTDRYKQIEEEIERYKQQR